MDCIKYLEFLSLLLSFGFTGSAPIFNIKTTDTITAFEGYTMNTVLESYHTILNS